MNNRNEQDGLITNETYECAQCGVDFDPDITNFIKVDNGNKVVCSVSCRNEWNIERNKVEEFNKLCDDTHERLDAFTSNKPAEPIDISKLADDDDSYEIYFQ